MALNITTAVIGSGCNAATASPSLAQWDKGQILQISGVELPETYKVEFSNGDMLEAIPAIGTAEGVEIPDKLLYSSSPIRAYIVLSEAEGERNTEYWVTIYVKPREIPEDIEPDPAQQDVIDDLIAQLNTGVGKAEAAADEAEASAQDAEAASQAVQDLGVEAETLAPGAPAAVQKIVDAETGAVTLRFGLPRGADGASPVVTVTTITGGHRVTVTDAAGAHTFDVMDGRSVTDVTMGADYKLTFTFSDGTTWTTPTSIRGETGATPRFTIGTVSTLDPDQSATASITGTPEDPVLNLGIPKGQAGATDAGGVTYDPTESYQSGTAGAALNDLTRQLSDVESASSKLVDRLQNYDGYIYINPFDFHLGNIFFGTNGWDYFASLQRVVTNEDTTIKLKAGDFVTLSDYSDARFCMGWILPDGTRKSNPWVTSGGYRVVDDAEYVILLAHKTEVNLRDKYELLDLLTIYRKPNTQEDVQFLKNDIKYITGSTSDHLLYSRTYSNTGTGSTVWDANSFPAGAIPNYFRVASAENLGTGITNYGNLFAHYSDGTSGFVTNNATGLNTWVPVNLSAGKTVTKYDVVCARGTVSAATTTTWTVEILCGDDIKAEIEELSTSAYGLNNPLFKPCAPKFAMHRGYSTEAPENTVPAFVLAGKAGAFAIETDIQETSDGVFVCFHDSTVDRMTDGTGTLYQKTYAQVQALTIDAGANIGSYPNLKIPTLEEYLTVCRRYGCVAFLHMGVINHVDEFVKTVTECGMLGSCVFLMGYDANRLKTVRTYTNAPAAILKYSTSSESVADVIALANSVINCTVSFDSSLITDSTYIKECHALNMPTNVWVVDSTATAEQFFALGVDTITSNSIPKLSNE